MFLIVVSVVSGLFLVAAVVLLWNAFGFKFRAKDTFLLNAKVAYEDMEKAATLFFWSSICLLIALFCLGLYLLSTLL